MADVNKSMKLNVDTSSGVSSLQALTGAFNGVLGVVGLVVTALGALTIAAVKAGKQFIDFERNVVKINTLLPRTERAAADVKGKLLELGKALPNQETDDLADSVYTLTSLLQDEAAAFELAEVAGRAAVGTNTEASITTDALTKAMKVFNLTTAEGKVFLDDYVAAVNAGVISGEKLGQNFGEAAIAMGGLNGSAVETLALFAQLAPALKEEQIKTGIKGVYVEVEKNKKKFEEAGVATDDWAQMLDDLEGKDLAKLFPNAEALIFIQALLKQKDEYRGLVAEIDASSGDLDAAFSAYGDSAGAVFDTASQSLDTFIILAGEQFSELGVAFIEGIGQENIDELFEDILDLIKAMIPPLVEIAKILSSSILKSAEDTEGTFSAWTDLLEDINYLLEAIGISMGTTEDDAVGIKDALMTIGNLINPIYYIWKLIEVVIGTIGDALRSWGDLFTGQISLLDHMANLAGGALLDNVKDVGKEILGLKEEMSELDRQVQTREADIALTAERDRKAAADDLQRRSDDYIEETDLSGLGYTDSEIANMKLAPVSPRIWDELSAVEGTPDFIGGRMSIRDKQPGWDELDIKNYIEAKWGTEVRPSGLTAYEWLRSKERAVILYAQNERKYELEAGATEAVGGIGVDERDDRTTGGGGADTRSDIEIARERLGLIKAQNQALGEQAELVQEIQDTRGQELGEEGKKREAAEKKALKDRAKALVKPYSDAIVQGIRSGNVLTALKDVFLNQLTRFVVEALSRAILQSAILAILTAISGGGGGAIQGAFGKGGYFHGSKVHYAADGLYLSNRYGSNVLGSQTGGVPVIAAEAGYDEVNMFAPLNDTGYDMMTKEVMPLFPQFRRGLAEIGQIGFAAGMRQSGGTSPTLNVNVDPILGTIIDVTVSEMADNGSRIRATRRTN